MAAQHGVGPEGRQHRIGIGEARGLDHHPLEAGDPALGAQGMEVEQRVGDFAPDRAAQAPRFEQDHRIIDTIEEMMVEADLAELVDQHGRVGEAVVGQHALQQRRLAGTEKPGQQVHGRRRRRARHVPASSRASNTGSSGSNGTPANASASGQRWESAAKTLTCPVAVEST